MELRTLPTKSGKWVVRTVAVTKARNTEQSASSVRAARLEEELNRLEGQGYEIRQVLETCLDGGKTWHYTVLCYR